MTQLPPVPPGCAYFGTCIDNDDNEHECFGFPDPESDFPIEQIINKANHYERGIIAAVARCAWLDEAKRQEAEEYKWLGESRREMTKHSRKRTKALEAARAWAAWAKE
jgi:hypothetical protein